MISTARHHLVAFISLTLITVNLLFWIPALVILALLKFCSSAPGFTRLCDRCVDFCYRGAVWANSAILKDLLRIKFHIDGEPPQKRNKRYLVVSNHRSWFDILVLQMLITRRGPTVKFLVKRELMFVPVVGWICLALNFPFLGRNNKGKRADYHSVASAAAGSDDSAWALLNFVEGTRFTAAKHQAQASPYQQMLKPKSGGLRIMLNNMPDVEIIDVTLMYPAENLNFWQCLSGRLRSIDVHICYHDSRDIDNVNSWLNARWLEKDARLEKKSSESV